MLLGSSGTGCVQQLDIPAVLHNSDYGTLFGHFVALGSLPVGLFRAPKAATGSLPFVYTNPPPETLIVPSDKLFAIARPHALSGQRNPFASTSSSNVPPPSPVRTPAPKGAPTTQVPSAKASTKTNTKSPARKRPGA